MHQAFAWCLNNRINQALAFNYVLHKDLDPRCMLELGMDAKSMF